jgi:archaemetzincin
MNENINILILNDISRSILRYLRKNLSTVFKCNVIILKRIIIPSTLFNDDKKQYDGRKLLKFLTENMTLREVKDINLAVFDRDLYKGNLDYVFSLASPFPKISVISIMRVHPHFNKDYFSRSLKKRKAGRFPLLVKKLNSAEKRLYYERILKEAVHGIGHTFGLIHCNNRSCIMYPSNTSDDIDGKDTTFCAACRSLI